MNTCRIAVFENAENKMVLQNTVIPALKEGEILVKNEYTTLCRSDILTYTGKRKEKSPTILGHEITGKIVDFGQGHLSVDIKGNLLKHGDRITWAIYASDPSSAFSQKGIPQKSADLFKYGHEQITEDSHLHGGLAEYTILRKFTPILRVQQEISVKVIALINCSVATVAGALRMAGDIKNKNVLITGAGMLGIIACAMASSNGANIISADINEERLQTTLNFGAQSYCIIEKDETDFKKQYEKNNQRVLPPIDIIIDFSGYPDTMEQTLEVLEIGGTAIWIGATFPQRNLQINAEKMVRKIWTIKGLHNYNETDFITAVDFIEKYHTKFPFEDLIYDGFVLEQANEAFEYAIANNPFRVGVSIEK